MRPNCARNKLPTVKRRFSRNKDTHREHPPHSNVKSPSRICTYQHITAPDCFTNGCFDILHRGICYLFGTSKGTRERHLVGVNSDASVRRLGKGDDRPINPGSQSHGSISSTEAVNLVVCFDEDTPLTLIQAIQPDVLVKGRRLKNREYRGRKRSSSRGGSVHSIPSV